MKLNKLIVLLAIPLVISGCHKKDTKNYFPEEEIKVFLEGREADITNYNLPVKLKKKELISYQVYEEEPPYFNVLIKDADNTKLDYVTNILNETNYRVDEDLYIDAYEQMAVKLTKTEDMLSLDVFACKDLDVNTHEEGKVRYTMPASLNENIENYNLSANYHNDYFRHSATILDDNLKMLSFASTIVSDSAERATNFFSKMFFDSFVSSGYDEITKETIGYVFAHKNIDDFELYAVCIRGFEYGAEWANNFLIGDSEDHYGFSLRGTEVYNDLNTYINGIHTEGKSVKVWVTGYSRAGAISDFVSMKIMNSGIYSIGQDTLYTYTFEAPASVNTAHYVAYPNVFNFVNSADLIPYVPPTQYGLGRTGTDIATYDANVESIVANFDPAIAIPAFTSKSDYATEQDFINVFMSKLLEDTGNDGSLHNREAFANNYQTDLGDMISFFFTLPPETSAKLAGILNDDDNPNKLSAWDYISIVLFDSNPLPDKIKPILDEDGITYDPDRLQECTDKLCRLLSTHKNLVWMFIKITWPLSDSGIDEDVKNNVSRSITMHYPEITYSLISSKNFAH